MTTAERLDALVRAACPAIDGVSMSVPPRINFRPEATPEQRAAAQAVVDGFNPSDAAQAEWELDRARANALGTLLTRADDTGIAVRAILNAVIYLVNNRLEALGQTRVLEAEILAFIAANPTVGDPT